MLPSGIKTKSAVRFLAILAVMANAGLASCAMSASPTEVLTSPSIEASAPASQTATPQPLYIDLPRPRLEGILSLEEALAKRRSVRQFSSEALTMNELGQLLWAAQGITHPAGLRTAPSAGALYPLEIYAVTSDGAYHYEAKGHRLTLQMPGDLRNALFEAALRQEAVSQAPAVFVIVAVYERTAKKYGEERSPRYVHLEAGHAAQNILLQAVTLELGAVPIGAFYDNQVKKTLDLPDEQQPLYLIPVGHPSEQ